MSATVAAALKKIALAILSDKKGRKVLSTIVLTLILVILMPIFAIIAILSGNLSFDTDGLVASVESNLSWSEITMLTNVEDTMKEIEEAMDEAGFSSSQTSNAQALYVMALYEYADEDDFVERLIGCFEEDQSQAELVENVNDEFGTDIPLDQFNTVSQIVRSNYIDCTRYTDITTKNNLDLVIWAEEAVDAGWGYVWGTYGRVMNGMYFEEKKAQYPNQVGRYEDFIRRNWIGKRTADCVGLIKGYCWFDPGSQLIGYGINGMPDVDTDYMLAMCEEQGDLDTLPEIPGLLLWKEGHVGIYIGGGYAIEAMGTTSGVVKTAVEGRGWTKWGKLLCIQYIEETEEPEETSAPSETEPPATQATTEIP